MGTSTLNIAVTGLNAAQAGLLTTSHNISNASTAGFNRQRVVQTTQNPQYTGAGFFGQGTRVQTVQRTYSEFLSGQVNTSQATTSQLESYLNQLGLIDNMLGDTTVGLSPAITSFFSGVNAVAATPSSIPARQTMLASGQTVVARFQDLSSRLQEIFDGTNTQIRTEVVTINSLARQVSELNHRISMAEAAGPSQQANDLHDQRDQLVLELNKHIRTDVIEQTDGSFSIFFGNGQPLVVGSNVFSLTTRQATNDATRLVIGLQTPNGQASEIPESLVSGGALGGLLQFRSESLDVAQNTLGRMALALASAFNAQHKLGQDLTGTMGNAFFRMPTPTVIADTGNQAPTANLTTNVTDVGALTTSDYTLSYGSNGYTLRRIEDDQVLFTSPTLPVTADGLTFIIDATPAMGSSYKIQATRYAARDIALSITDPRSIAAGLPASASAGVNNTGTATISQGGLKTPVTLTYSGFSTGFTGFPPGSSVVVWNPATATSTTTAVTVTSQSVSIPAGSFATVNGITFKLSAVPANGDTFTIGPNQLAQGDDNTGSAAISAAAHMRTTLAYDNASGTFSLAAPIPDPLLNTMVTVNNAGTVTNYPIRLGNETIPYVNGATYTVNGVSFVLAGTPTASGDIVVGYGYSNTPDAAVPDTPPTGMTLTTVPSTGYVPSAALPTSNYTLTYHHDSTAANTRLTGFPPGTTVAVTVNGTTQQYAISSPDQGVPYTAGMTIMVNGFETRFNGVPAEGDTFTIGPTTSNTTDSRNIQALAALQTSKIMLGGSASLESSYAQMVSTIGNKAREIQATYDAQEALLQQATDAVQSFSGVNLDEEAANLLRYQQAYQAAAKIIDISGKLFDLLATLG